MQVLHHAWDTCTVLLTFHDSNTSPYLRHKYSVQHRLQIFHPAQDTGTPRSPGYRYSTQPRIQVLHTTQDTGAPHSTGYRCSTQHRIQLLYPARDTEDRYSTQRRIKSYSTQHWKERFCPSPDTGTPHSTGCRYSTWRENRIEVLTPAQDSGTPPSPEYRIQVLHAVKYIKYRSSIQPSIQNTGIHLGQDTEQR
jgi:hypothetical protein